MLLQIKNLYKGYGQPGSHAFRQVLENLSWQVDAGSMTGIVGASGSGKTTLLNMIGALDKPDSGEIFFDGEMISRFTPDELAHFRNRKLGFVFQQHHLLPQLTLWENVLLPLLPARKPVSADDKAWAEKLLRETGIWEQRNQKPSSLSGGECQRTAVVRAMINRPRLILADEPTGALDEENAGILAGLLTGISKNEGTTLVVVTHSSEMAGRMEKVFHLRKGSLTSP